MTLVPQHIGTESYALDPRLGAKAFPGTGFDPDNKQHISGSDAVRYAIALQQLRDKGDYTALDKARSFAEYLGYVVMQDRDGTRVKPRHPVWTFLSAKERKSLKIDSYECPVVDGIFYDCEARK